MADTEAKKTPFDLCSAIINKFKPVLDQERVNIFKNALVGYHNKGRGYQMFMFPSPKEAILFLKKYQTQAFQMEVPYLNLDENTPKLSEELCDNVTKYNPDCDAVGIICIQDGEEFTFHNFVVQFRK